MIGAVVMWEDTGCCLIRWGKKIHTAYELLFIRSEERGAVGDRLRDNNPTASHMLYVYDISSRAVDGDDAVNIPTLCMGMMLFGFPCCSRRQPCVAVKVPFVVRVLCR